MTILNLIYRFEIEHVFSEDVFKDTDRKAFLESLGFEQQARINQIPLLSEPRIVAELQNSSPEAKTLFLNAGWGFNRHDRQAIPGNFQAGKNEFLREKADDIVSSRIEDASELFGGPGRERLRGSEAPGRQGSTSRER